MAPSSNKNKSAIFFLSDSLKELLQSLFDLMTAKKSTNGNKNKGSNLRNDGKRNFRSERNRSESIKRPLRKSGDDDEGGKKCGDKGRKKNH